MSTGMPSAAARLAAMSTGTPSAATRPGATSSHADRRDRPETSAPGPTSIGVLAVVVAVAGFLVLCWGLRSFVTDDAWISLRYARNLATGHGFVWNPGGPPVEGYSNPALVLIEALAYLAGVGGLVVARGLGVAAGVAAIVVVWWRGRELIGEDGAAAAAVIVGLAPAMAYWAVGGLETLPVALVLAAAALELGRPGGGSAVRAGALLAILPWLRPEALAYIVPLALLSEAVLLLRTSTRRAGSRRLAAVAGIPLISALVLEVQRLVTFGHLLPNSVIYKVGDDPGGVSSKFLLEAAPVIALAALGAVVVRSRVRLLAVPVLAYLAGGLFAADSVNTFSRFMLPVWPLLAVLAGGALGALTLAPARAARSLPPWLPAAVGAAVVVGLVAGVLPGNVFEARSSATDYRACKTAARLDAGDWLRANTPPEGVASVSDAGLVPVRAQRRFLDQFWLNDPRLQEFGGKPSPARRADLLMRADPDAIVLASDDRVAFDAEYPTDAAVADHPSMVRYRLAHVASADEDCGYHLFVYLHGRGARGGR